MENSVCLSSSIATPISVFLLHLLFSFIFFLSILIVYQYRYFRVIISGFVSQVTFKIQVIHFIIEYKKVYSRIFLHLWYINKWIKVLLLCFSLTFKLYSNDIFYLNTFFYYIVYCDALKTRPLKQFVYFMNIINTKEDWPLVE